MTRRVARAIKAAEEATLGNEASPLMQLPDELLLRVARAPTTPRSSVLRPDVRVVAAVSAAAAAAAQPPPSRALRPSRGFAAWQPPPAAA